MPKQPKPDPDRWPKKHEPTAPKPPTPPTPEDDAEEDT
jgi:hypothetical protein